MKDEQKSIFITLFFVLESSRSRREPPRLSFFEKSKKKSKFGNRSRNIKWQGNKKKERDQWQRRKSKQLEESWIYLKNIANRKDAITLFKNQLRIWQKLFSEVSREYIDISSANDGLNYKRLRNDNWLQWASRTKIKTHTKFDVTILRELYYEADAMENSNFVVSKHL